MRSALCSHCCHFQPTNLSHSVQSLPESLTVYTGCNESVASVFWEQQSVHVANEATLTANVHGSKVDQGEDLWDQMRELDVSWIPESFKLRRLANGTLKGGATSEKSNVVEEQVEYELQSVCFTIVDPQTGKATNVVAAIKVGTYNSARFVLPESQWYLFNDFSINPIDSSEATWIDLNLKVPSILVYRRVERNEVSVPFHPQPSPSIGLDIFQPSQGHEGPLSFCPLDDNEVPRAGDLVALDAEFVTLTPEEKSPHFKLYIIL
ncbi:PAN2-PAN3 deadenylation complex catalytic subunit PAN2-like [Tigriopus californicus]|uniref:PAN2-PAN3 deadenylation complex catalytic subunit PAN2-like n=1 Tax=Tigriopus californicus TaxID=6832 RepID=UPI0027DAB163|nr:PAN2-PAN3 deadenylation complex catalytic subunit PAN2-like [Tigriopus californicus]